MPSAKETAANVAASATAGMDMTRPQSSPICLRAYSSQLFYISLHVIDYLFQVEKLSVHSPVDKDMVEERKQEKFWEAESNKAEEVETNAAARACGNAADTGFYPISDRGPSGAAMPSVIHDPFLRQR